ncbi:MULTISPECIES: aldo/keto reductase [unclassified Planococcus (in: firmicutes)]|uniref:aldo/keto reductase n=1 Tax=unclassified Planococcus (in: firmicutes) TaxID=2662419 RepID=UPI000C32D841|nr:MULTISPECIES: aldo/keto reductase [unclassified Planococcus (in: firmicutes)]AUD13134.1 2,5-diketo-D-gluconic acid reductase [Planococcus sp. MB-3u-03]PKG45384.1 2,5-diketo-D-gluconic acid reductase [Planococcus sp. Urea-trap-24]PKG89020.1 2,5-diketo-D-gluconic acid reductase [Planococcus sp. Urea-3u-39]PKH36388.1 2,5-diketo-D-gluconic acid reductase [Planococcus sp. MB-3u-09]
MNKAIPEVTLNDGTTLPVTGLGTYGLWGNAGANSVSSGINAGYRLIDTAYNYENEGAVGEGIKRSGISHDDLWITSKLPGRYHEYDKAMVAIQESLYRSKLDYFDLYVIHWPLPNQDLYAEAWQALIDAQKWGLVRSIGVSNFLPEHLERIIKETGVTPSLNQVELHPFFNQEEQRRAHAEHHIQTQSWSPIARAADILSNDTVSKIAESHHKTIPQVVLRWQYQIGSVSIPRSTSPTRQRENLDIFDFELSETEMTAIAGLSRPDGRLFGMDPATHEEF